MSLRGVCVCAGALVGAGFVLSNFAAFAVPPSVGESRYEGATVVGSQRFLTAAEANAGAPQSGLGLGGVCAAIGLSAVVLSALAAGARQRTSQKPATTFVPCHAQLQEEGASSVDFFKQAVGGAAAAVIFATSAADSAAAYPIFAQQNYKNPREATGKLACANCHLAVKPVDVQMPHEVLADTIFKATIDIPSKYEKRQQLIADGTKASLNVGAICVMPEGFKLAPKDRLPKPIKKEMKGLAWAPYSKELPNIVVAGPVPGLNYPKLTLPILAPDPSTNADIHFDKYTFYWGGNRGRGQVYPEGNLSNNNVFKAPFAGTVTAIDGMKITISGDNGKTSTIEVLPGGDIIVKVGEKVMNEDQLTTNPNVGGFGQDEKELVLQDMNRVYAYCALATSIFLAQLAFVLKKKQFEKVQLAEGF